MDSTPSTKIKSQQSANKDNAPMKTGIKVYGILCLVSAALLIPNAVSNIIALVNAFTTGTMSRVTGATQSLYFILVFLVPIILAAFMLADGFMTLFSLDGWYNRLAGITPDNALG